MVINIHVSQSPPSKKVIFLVLPVGYAPPHTAANSQRISLESQLPQPIAQEMRVLNHRPLTLGLDLVGSADQRAHGTRLLLALGHDDDGLALVQLPAPAAVGVDALVHLPAVLEARGGPLDRQPAPLGRQAGGHERRAHEHEADGAAVDADRREALREAVHEPEVRHDGGRVVLLVEERLRIQHVQRVAVGQLHARQRRLLGQDLVNVRRQQGVRREQRLAEGPLHRRLELLLGRGGDAALVSLVEVPCVWLLAGSTYSFLNILGAGCF